MNLTPEQKLIERLRADLADPPLDLQERVIQKCNLVSKDALAQSQRDLAAEKVLREQAQRELAEANHWRERHSKDAEAYGKQSQENWEKWQQAQRERDEALAAMSADTAVVVLAKCAAETERDELQQCLNQETRNLNLWVKKATKLGEERDELQAKLLAEQAAGARLRPFVESLECKCDSATYGGYTCPRCHALSWNGGKALLEELGRWDELKLMVPKPPNAITWEHGVELLNRLQAICYPREALK